MNFKYVMVLFIRIDIYGEDPDIFLRVNRVRYGTFHSDRHFCEDPGTFYLRNKILYGIRYPDRHIVRIRIVFVSEKL